MLKNQIINTDQNIISRLSLFWKIFCDILGDFLRPSRDYLTSFSDDYDNLRHFVLI